MSFGLRRKRALDPGVIGVGESDLPPLPDTPGPARVDPRRWFPDPARPLEIEIGSGKGTFLLQQATLEPGTNYLGIEWAGEFYEYAADRCRRAGLKNVRLLNADAAEFIRWRCPDAVTRVLHVYFPDPWPKTRHHKRRLINEAFLTESSRILEPGGELRVVTDHEEYWAWMEERFARATEARGGGPPPPFERLPFERPGSAGAGELVGSNFERKYRREGRPFHAAVLRKAADL